MRKGIILAGGSGTRLHPMTKVVSKQLIPIYDKPMIFYPLSTLMQAGIRELLIITTPQDQHLYKSLLGNGQEFGISISYACQPKPEGLAQALIIAEKFLANLPSALILGDNLFYGNDLTKLLKKANKRNTNTIFAYHVSNPSSYGVVDFDSSGNATSIEEKPKNSKSNYAVPGIYFFDKNASRIAKTLKPSERGELEIVDLMKFYLKNNQLFVEKIKRGNAWLDTGTIDDLLAAAQFIETIEKRQGLKVNCPEEVAFKNGWISKNQLCSIAKSQLNSGYGQYLLRLIKNK